MTPRLLRLNIDVVTREARALGGRWRRGRRVEPIPDDHQITVDESQWGRRQPGGLDDGLERDEGMCARGWG